MERQPHRTATASASRSNEQNDELSFLDYLRTAGGTVRDARPVLPDRRESRDSADRKRRHTGSGSGSAPERRNYPYPQHHGRPSDLHGAPRSGMQSGSSRDTAIDLTASPGQAARPSYSRMQGSDDSRDSGGRYGRSDSDLVLPRWQPDHEVTQCPVCDTEFSLLYRRHHCRKCGRVVCHRCSPHRITIPRQYIVQPPNPYLLEDGAGAEPSSPPSRGNPALGGGDIVRVCNPCVPDPWMPHTTTAASAPIAPVPPPPSMAADDDDFDWNSIEPPNPLEESDRWEREHGPVPSQGRLSLEPFYAGLEATSVPPISTRHHGHRYSHSSGAGPAPNVVPPPTSFAPPNRNREPRQPHQVAMPPPPVPEQSRPRRQIPEEDECPVCGEEMLPGERVREAHIETCIAARFSSTPTQGPVAGTIHDEAENDPNMPGGSRPRASSFRPRGMFKSKATEKDCVAADGEQQECIICFEEFEPGDDLGTMECWCKFHRDCIRGWWEKKGAGSCPTHRLYD